MEFQDADASGAQLDEFFEPFPDLSFRPVSVLVESHRTATVTRLALLAGRVGRMPFEARSGDLKRTLLNTQTVQGDKFRGPNDSRANLL